MMKKILLHLLGSCLFLIGLQAVASNIVIAGSNGTIVTSPDGVTWSQQPSMGKSAITTTMGHDNYYVALTANGCSLTSSNGLNWQKHCSHAIPLGRVRDIMWAQHKYIVLYSNKTKSGIYASADGINWKPIYRQDITSHTRNVLTSMNHIDETLIVAGRASKRDIPCSNDIMRSRNLGVTWERKSYPMCINGISSNKKKVILFGFTSDKPAQSVVNISDDEGISFNWPSMAVGLPGQAINWVTEGKNLYVAVGVDTADHHAGILFTSSDGKIWVQNNVPRVAELNKVVWANNQYIAFGQKGVILTSPNGVHWTWRDSKTTQSLYDIAW